MPNFGNGKNAGYGRGANGDVKRGKGTEKWDGMKVQEEKSFFIVIFLWLLINLLISKYTPV